MSTQEEEEEEEEVNHHSSSASNHTGKRQRNRLNFLLAYVIRELTSKIEEDRGKE